MENEKIKQEWFKDWRSGRGARPRRAAAFPRSYQPDDGTALLTVQGGSVFDDGAMKGDVCTRLGVQIPGKHARRAWPVLARIKEQGGADVGIRVGNFQIDRIDGEGTVLPGATQYLGAR